MEIYILWIIIAAGLGIIPANIAKTKGYDNFALWWLYGWMLFIVAIIHVSVIPDRSVPVIYDNPAEELKKYKELLDQGIITQEEFDAKKEQLLAIS